MPKQSQTAQAFARAEAKLREEITHAEAVLARAQGKSATASARLEELLRVKELIAGQDVAATPAQPKAKKAAKPKAKRAARSTGGLPTPGTAARAVLDAVLAGARDYRDIRERTGFATGRIGGTLPDLVRRGLVVRSGMNEYAPAEGVG